MTEDDDIRARLRAWRIAPPTGDTAQKIISAAFGAPQRLPLLTHLAWELNRCLTDWRYGLPYKAAAAAACLVLGAGAGLIADEPVDIAGIALLAGH